MTGIRRVGIILCSLLLSIFWASMIKAQEQGGWSPPYRLSSEEGVFVGWSNRAVSDQYGYTHAFWLEEGLPNDYSIIQYARFDGKTWTTPLDIYATKASMDSLSLAIDRQDTLHLIWTEGGGYRQRPVYYAYASVHNATSITNWSIPSRIDIQAHLIQLQVDSEHTLHILYSQFFGSEPGIYYLRSEDQGQSWSDPIRLDPDILPDSGPGSLEFALDETDGLHAVWHYVPLDAVGGDWIRYAQSLDGGETWSLPFTIDKDDEGSGKLRMPGPIIGVQGQAVHIIWAAGGNLLLRQHRFSTDAGQTWSAPLQILGNLNGQAGDGTAIDGAGRVHFVSQIRFPMGIWHAYWDQDRWIGPSLIYLMKLDTDDPQDDRLNVHSTHPIIRAGNQLVVTFYDRSDERPFALYAMHHILQDIPPLLPAPTPARTPIPTPTTQPDPTSTPLAPTPTQTTQPFDSSAALPPVDVPGPAKPFLLALIPTLLLVGSTITFQLLKKH